MEDELEGKDDPEEFGPGPGLTPSGAESRSRLFRRAREAGETARTIPDEDAAPELVVE